MTKWIKQKATNLMWLAAFWAIIIAFVSGLYWWDKMFPSPPMSPEEEMDYYNGVPSDKNNRWGQ